MRRGGDGVLGCALEISENMQMSGAQTGQRRGLGPSRESVFARLTFF